MSEHQDDVDLRPYLLALKRHWWQIAIIAVLLAGVAIAFSLLQPRVYRATAMLLLTRSRSRLALAEQFPTVNENVDSKSRLDALVSITKSDAVAMATLQSVRERLALGELSLNSFKNRIDVNTEGDVIEVVATADKPKLASEIANTWAGQAVAAINAAYGGEQPLLIIQDGLGSAQEKYEAAQTAYESFVKENQITFLEAQADELNNLLATLGSQRSWQFSYNSYRIQRMDQILADAKALQSQLKGGSDSTAAGLGDALAVLMAHASVFGVNPQFVDLAGNNLVTPAQSGSAGAGQVTLFQNNPPAYNSVPVVNLQLDGLAELVASPVDYQEDLDRLIQQVTLQRDEAKTNLDELANQVTQGEGDELLLAAAEQLRKIEGRLEIEKARERELLGERNLAWEAYEAMLQKEAELVNASQVINEVTLAGPAVEPQHPADPGTIRNAIIGGLIGLILAVCGILFLEWWHTTNESR